MLHQVMHLAPYHLIRMAMAVKMAREAGPFFSVVDSMFAHNVG
jgi:hypothetical protein